MPLILSRQKFARRRLTHLAVADSRIPAVRIRYVHSAVATSVVRLRMTHEALSTTSRRRATAHPARATSELLRVQMRHLAVTGASMRVRLEHPALATQAVVDSSTGDSTPVQPMPTVYRAGLRPRTTRLTSSLGRVISAQYAHTGTRQTLTMTIAGIVTPQPTLDLTVQEFEGSALRGSFSTLLDGDLTQYEHHMTSTGGTTVLRAEHKKATRLGSARLREFVPWKLSPTPFPDRRVPCKARPKAQETDVSGIVAKAFQEVGLGLSFITGDPLLGQKFKEGERDYSTLGKTPDQVWSDTYGQLGYVYIIDGDIASALPAGGYIRRQRVLEDQIADGMTIRAEAVNTPNILTVTGADLLLDRPSLVDLAEIAPDRDSLLREVVPNIDWYVTTPTASGETIKGFRKALGVVTYTNELTRSDVIVTETVDGAKQSRIFGGVVTGYTSTDSTYDDSCPDALIRQRTVKQSFGYSLGTDTHGRIFSGPGWIGSYQTGDVLADEEQTVYQTFSPEGYLSYRTTITRRLASLQQQGADGPVKGRGPLQAREYVTQTLSESYQPIGHGQWLRVWSMSGDQQLPLYDQETGDAVRLATRAGASNSGVELVDQAPAQVRCPDLCVTPKVAYPQAIRQVLQDGREGVEATRALPFVASTEALQGYARIIAASLAATELKELDLSGVQDWRPGVQVYQAVSGIIEGLNVDASNGLAKVRLSVRQLALNGSFGSPAPEGDGPFRDMVVWRAPGGVYVNHLREIKQGEPKFDQIFVRASGANLPNPGDEIEWIKDTRFGPTATGNYGT